MKKVWLSLLIFTVFLASCHKKPAENVVYQKAMAAETSPAYTEWDRAIRVDTDMQNMYTATPSNIEKPIDMYMAMALALKYNYSRRMTSYEQSMLEAGRTPLTKIPEVLTHAGYINDTNSKQLSSDLKVTWNILDISTVYYQNKDKEYKANVAFEQSRKVIHNILQETRVMYWKSLSAQRLIPLIDDMTEFMTLEVDEINSQAKLFEAAGKTLSTETLVKKREYMESVKKLAALRRKLETSETRLASLMGFHPSTTYKLVGSEYGNFELPEIKSNLSQLEWLALNNRPELRVQDLSADSKNLKIAVKGFEDPGARGYKNDPEYYNKLWSKKAKEVGLSILEDVRNPNQSDLDNLRRQRMTSLILSQVYVSWAMVMSAAEDYQINKEIADTSENIAEDITVQNGNRATKSHFESSRAIEDEVKAYLAYIDLQEALGNMYATIGLDALPYYMLNEKPSKIAVYLRLILDKWKTGDYLPENRPYLMDVPTQRPPVNLSSHQLPDIEVEVGQRINITIPDSVLRKMDPKGKITAKAGLANDAPLPKWLKFDENTLTLSGVAMPSDTGSYKIKIYITDEAGNVGYILFTIKVIEVYVPSMSVEGLTEGRRAEVLKRCIGSKCSDDYINESTIGLEVAKDPR